MEQKSGSGLETSLAAFLATLAAFDPDEIGGDTVIEIQVERAPSDCAVRGAVGLRNTRVIGLLGSGRLLGIQQLLAVSKVGQSPVKIQLKYKLSIAELVAELIADLNFEVHT